MNPCYAWHLSTHVGILRKVLSVWHSSRSNPAPIAFIVDMASKWSFSLQIIIKYY